MDHKWHEVQVQGFQAFHCDSCEYLVIAFPHDELPDGESVHFPSERMILVGKEKITIEEAEAQTKLWHVHCKLG